MLWVKAELPPLEIAPPLGRKVPVSRWKMLGEERSPPALSNSLAAGSTASVWDVTNDPKPVVWLLYRDWKKIPVNRSESAGDHWSAP